MTASHRHEMRPKHRILRLFNHFRAPREHPIPSSDSVRIALGCAMVLAMFGAPAWAQGGGGCLGTTRVSVDSSGQQAWGSSMSSVSGDGRFTAFSSLASNLVSGDNNGSRDIFVHDSLTGTTIRASVHSKGAEGAKNSHNPSISADGRYVAFDSLAQNLVPGDTNTDWDVFVHDTKDRRTVRVSLNSAGGQVYGDSRYPSISADGRFVAFESTSSGLVLGDNNKDTDVFLHDTLTGTTSRVSVSSAGAEGDSESYSCAVSDDGRRVVFASYASNLMGGNTWWTCHTYLHDTQTKVTSMVSVNSSSQEADWDSFSPSISGDGRFVSFDTAATNLVPGDTNNNSDVFLRDTLAGTTSRISVGTAGEQGEWGSMYSSVSADGRFVAFESYATTLVPGDTNQSGDIFLRDTLLGTTKRVSLSSDGAQGDGHSTFPSISAAGDYVSFDSDASTLVQSDTNNSTDIFVACTLAPCFNKYCRVEDGSINNYVNLDVNSCDLSQPIVLQLSGGPVGQFTYLLIGAGSNVVSNPAGAVGDLCITGGFFARYRKDLGQISTAGTFSVDISNSLSGGPGFGIPNSSGAAIQSGETWNFQYWFRNPAPKPSGFSEAIAITFK